MTTKGEQKEYSHKYYEKHKEQLQAYRRRPEIKQKINENARKRYNGTVQKWKEENPDYSSKWQKTKYWSNPTLFRLQAKEIRHLNKVRVLLYYSNPQGSIVCNNCGEQNIDMLCIDHIKGGGNKHQKSLQSQGTNLYLWLVKNNYPKGFQVLCANCNMQKARLEY